MVNGRKEYDNEDGFASAKTSARHTRRPEYLATPETFPDRYDETYLVLMEIDPWALFSYWEIHEKDLERAQSHLACKSSVVIRIYDVTDMVFDGGNAHGWFDIEVEGHAHNWYIYPNTDGRSYMADIGLRGEDGRFVVLARSNCAQMPRATTGHQADEVWMEVENDPRKKHILPKRLVAPPEEDQTPRRGAPGRLDTLKPVELMNSIDRHDVIDYCRSLWEIAGAASAPMRDKD